MGSRLKILVLHADENAGRAVIQSLGAAGHECCAAAISPDSSTFASRYARSRAIHPSPLVDKPAFQAWVVEQQRRERFDLILPTTEETLIPLHEIREDPDLAGRLAIPPAAAVEQTFDKEATRRLAVSLGVPAPETVLVERPEDLDAPIIDEWLGQAPVVVKGTRSKVWHGPAGKSYAVRLAHDRRELSALARKLLPLMPVQVQRWVPGRGMGVEVLARHGEIVLAFAHDRVHEVPLSGGASSYRRSIDPPSALLDAAARLMRGLGWHGVAMVEFRVDAASGRHWLMEINGRFWGSLPLAIFAGADFPRALVDLLCFDRVPEGPGPVAGVYARKLGNDVQWIKAVLADRSSGRRRFTHTLLPALLEWGRLVSGRETWDGLQLDDPGPILHEVASIVRREARAVQRKLDRAFVLREARGRGASALRRLGKVERVLVLCYGNICRSPYVEARLSPLVESRRLQVRSRGFHPEEARRTPERIQSAARTRGVDLSPHRSARVSLDDLRWADAILVMDGENHASLRALSEESLAKELWLGAFDRDERVEIADPYDAEAAEVDAVFARIDACVASLQEALGTKA